MNRLYAPASLHVGASLFDVVPTYDRNRDRDELPLVRIGQAPTWLPPIAVGTPFVCVHPYQCDLYNDDANGVFRLIGSAPSGSIVTAAPPWPAPPTNRMGVSILVDAMTPYGPKQGWTLSQYLRAYSAPIVTPRPRALDPRVRPRSGVPALAPSIDPRTRAGQGALTSLFSSALRGTVR